LGGAVTRTCAVSVEDGDIQATGCEDEAVVRLGGGWLLVRGVAPEQDAGPIGLNETDNLRVELETTDPIVDVYDVEVHPPGETGFPLRGASSPRVWQRQFLQSTDQAIVVVGFSIISSGPTQNTNATAIGGWQPTPLQVRGLQARVGTTNRAIEHRPTYAVVGIGANGSCAGLVDCVAFSAGLAASNQVVLGDAAPLGNTLLVESMEVTRNLP
jgi:hypothetical protein